jgi:hypothetical protein
VEVGCCLSQVQSFIRMASSVPLILYVGEDGFDEAY